MSGLQDGTFNFNKFLLFFTLNPKSFKILIISLADKLNPEILLNESISNLILVS